MENDTLFSNVPENKKGRQQGKQHLHKFATQTNNKSLISNSNSTFNTARRLSAYQLALRIQLQRRPQSINSFKVERRFNTFQDDSNKHDTIYNLTYRP
ncbi:hypothetical protein AVEN_13592-1 [Araneus ventricosus]|uniref:Uncharacterized protein n=1 Tax=Araneus ventricosus TaxID=182803 RepID=A0A4Y2D3R2_ARAVE|nr:hypothetical protein AVEN_13592-1 [Araneus ventricosus]